MKKKKASCLSAGGKANSLRAYKVEGEGRKKDSLKFILHANEGWSYERMAATLFLGDQTSRNYWEEYEKGGLESLLTFKYEGRLSNLSSDQKQELKQHLLENTYFNAVHIRSYIKDKYKIGFVYKKALLVPGDPDIVKQQEFIKQYEERKASMGEDEEILFIDGVQCILLIIPRLAMAGYLEALRRRSVPTLDSSELILMVPITLAKLM